MGSSRSRRVFAVAVLLTLATVACNSEEADAPTLPVAETPEPDPTCPLTGARASEDRAIRPAVAVKIENSPAGYPLSGLGEAEIVFEELVEGGMTRFMAVYHCTDAKKAGPVRSARLMDPPVIAPITRILAAAGANAPVEKALGRAGIVTVDEDTPGNALRRIVRPGVSSEHTLYADSAAVRKVGSKRFDEAPTPGSFTFGALPSGGRTAREVTLAFTQNDPIVYEWSGGTWKRSQHGAPFEVEGKLAIDNLIIELHKVDYSKTLFDVVGNPSIEIADPIGSGRALVFRDGKVFDGTWRRGGVTKPVVYETRAGEPLALKEGTTWVALLPDSRGDVKGTFSIRPEQKRSSKKK